MTHFYAWMILLCIGLFVAGLIQCLGIRDPKPIDWKD